jgi:hypothetical protein
MMIGTRPGQTSQPYLADKLEAVGPRWVLLTLCALSCNLPGGRRKTFADVGENSNSGEDLRLCMYFVLCLPSHAVHSCFVSTSSFSASISLNPDCRSVDPTSIRRYCGYVPWFSQQWFAYLHFRPVSPPSVTTYCCWPADHPVLEKGDLSMDFVWPSLRAVNGVVHSWRLEMEQSSLVSFLY